MHTRFRTSVILSLIVAGLAVVQSIGGLFLNGLYRNNLWGTSQFRGNDLVTLALGVPTLLIALSLARRGSLRAQLVWLGALWYMLYNYLFYLFGAAFNEFFLIYVALVAFSGLALIFALPRLDMDAVHRSFPSTTPVKWISSYMWFWALGLGGLWVAQSAAFILTGAIPESIPASGGTTSLVFAIDLAMMIPALILSAVWLSQRKPWGYALTVIMNVKGVIYAAALAVMGVFAVRAGVPESASLIPLWIFFTFASLFVSLTLMNSMRAVNEETVPGKYPRLLQGKEN